MLVGAKLGLARLSRITPRQVNGEDADSEA